MHHVLPRQLGVICMAVTMALAGQVVMAHEAAAQAREQSYSHGGVHVEVRVDRTSIYAFEHITLMVRVTSPPDTQIEMPLGAQPQPAEGATLGDFAIGAVIDDAPISSGTPESPATTRTRRLSLEPFLPGDYTIPQIEVPWRKLDGSAKGSIRSSPFQIKVTSKLPEEASDATASSLDTGELRSEYTPEGERGGWGVTIGIAAGIAVLGGAWLFVAQRRRGARIDPLAACEAKLAAWPHDGSDTAEGMLTDAVVHACRAALADRVDPMAAACTGQELAAVLKSPGADDHARRMVAIVLDVDESRFSGASLEPDRRRELLSQTLAAVRGLRSRPSIERGVGR